MYAIVKQKTDNGIEFYYSVVFGYYRKITAKKDSYAKYMQQIYSGYYLVLNKEKTGLIKKFVYEIENKYLDPMILILDDSSDDWAIEENDCGCVDILKDMDLDNLPHSVLEKCIAIDKAYHFDEIRSISTQKDIKDFYAATGYLHDSAIEKLEKHNEDLHVVMAHAWGCDVEIWFSGDVEYNVDGHDPQNYDSTWYDCTLVIQDGFIYLIDDENIKPEEIADGYSYFKARSMKYKILPRFSFKSKSSEEIEKTKQYLK